MSSDVLSRRVLIFFVLLREYGILDESSLEVQVVLNKLGELGRFAEESEDYELVADELCRLLEPILDLCKEHI